MPKVSVIVPIYKTEQYIERCARSLFDQTLDDIEYIFVDDCTPDHTVDVLKTVLKDYPERFDQVKIIELDKNSGIAVVRKLGIQMASGDYVIHCDSDDWVDIDMYKSMYDFAVSSESDIAVCDFYQTDCMTSTYVKSCFHTESGRFLHDLLCGKGYWSLCNKLIRRTLYRDVIYPSCDMGEDMFITLQLLSQSLKVVYIEKAYYYYYINNSSIVRCPSREAVIKRFQGAVKNAGSLEQILKNKYKSIKYVLAFDVLKMNQLNVITALKLDRNLYKQWVSVFPELHFRLWLNPYLSLREKAKYYLRLFRLYK